MRKRKLIILAAAICSIVAFSNCNKSRDNDKCLSYANAQITSVTGPGLVAASQEAPFLISYQFTNGCGHFERLESNTIGDTTIINVIGKYEGCICTEVLIAGQASYKFKASQAGVYYFKFFQRDKSYLVDSITVN